MTARALVTGATGGLGRAVCKDLLALNYEVFGIGRSERNLQELSDLGVSTLQVDLSEEDAASKITLEFPEVEILINNAGVFPIKNLEMSSMTDYQEVFDVNVKIPFELMTYYIPRMKQSGFGKVLNVLSSSAFGGSPDTALYCASKHALLGLTRSAFLENRGSCVQVYSVSPGSMKTPMGATDTRQDFNTFIEPSEVSRFICHTLTSCDSSIYDEVRINRNVIR